MYSSFAKSTLLDIRSLLFVLVSSKMFVMIRYLLHVMIRPILFGFVRYILLAIIRSAVDHDQVINKNTTLFLS